MTVKVYPLRVFPNKTVTPFRPSLKHGSPGHLVWRMTHHNDLWVRLKRRRNRFHVSSNRYRPLLTGGWGTKTTKSPYEEGNPTVLRKTPNSVQVERTVSWVLPRLRPSGGVRLKKIASLVRDPLSKTYEPRPFLTSLPVVCTP